jgi:uncharacterized membrane protein
MARPVNPEAAPRRSAVANVVFGVLDPMAYGCFAAALVFDIVYLRSAGMLWNKGAAWLIVFGLLAAIIPRFINLAQVWIGSRRRATRADIFAFWCNLFAIVAATFNVFVHSRDAYAVVPAGMWLSMLTVLLLVLGRAATAAQAARRGELP